MAIGKGDCKYNPAVVIEAAVEGECPRCGADLRWARHEWPMRGGARLKVRMGRCACGFTRQRRV